MASKKKGANLASVLKKNLENAPKNYGVEHDVENYKTRLSNAGIDAKEATDSRNPIEKALNLTEDQNVLFDIFEIMGRPQQALFGAIDAAQKGKNVGKAALEGLKGNKQTSGGQLLRNAGIDSDGINGAKEGGLNPLSWGIDDVLGFGLDILADPIDIALLASVPATGGMSTPAVAAKFAGDAGQAGKVIKTVSKADDVMDAARAASKVDKAMDTAKVINKVDNAVDAMKVADTASDVSKTRYAIRPFQKGAKSINELVMEGAGKGAKKLLKIGDTALEKTLGLLDNATIKKIDNFARKNNISQVDAMKVLNIQPNKLDNYQAIKKIGKKAVDNSKALDGLVNKSKEIENISDIQKKGATLVSKELDDTARAIAKNMAKNADEEAEIYNDIAKSINTVIESNRDWTIKGDEILGALQPGKKVDMFSEENAKILVDKLNEYGVKANVSDGRFVKVTKGKEKLSTLQNDDILRKEFGDLKFGERLSKEDRLDIENAYKLINSSPELQDLLIKSEEFMPNVASQADTITGLDAANITREGYVPHVLSDEYRTATKRGKNPNPTKAFESRKWQMTTNEANRMKEAENARKLSENARKKAKYSSDIYKTDELGEVILDKSGDPIRQDNLYNQKIASKEKTINNYKATKESADELLRYKNTGEINLEKLTPGDARRFKVIQNQEKLQQTLEKLKKIDVSGVNSEAPIIDVNDAFKEVKKAQKELSKALLNNADDDTIKSLEKAMNQANKDLRIKTRVLERYADKAPRDLLKNVTKSFEKGKDVGEKIQKTRMKLSINIDNTNNIYQSAADISESLVSKIKYEEAALRKLDKASSDTLFKLREEQIEALAKSDALLSSLEGKEFFKTNFFTNIDTYINKSAEFNKSAQLWNEAITTGIFRNKEYVKTLDDINGKIPYGFKKIRGGNAKKLLEKYEGILPKGSTDFKDTLKFLGDNEYVLMDNDLVNMLKLSEEATSNQLKPLLNLWDGINRTFKKFSTLTLGFHARNIMGNTTNMALSGMPVSSMPKYYKKSAELWNKADDLTAKFFKGTLTDAEKADWSILEQFYRGGFSNESYAKIMGLEDIKVPKKGITNKISQKSIEMNEFVDGHNRLALLMYANDNPKYVQKLGKADAIEAVKYVLFDPSNMSDLEKTTLKRIMPFYTFTKQNLMFQADNIMKNTPKYNRLFKTLNKMYDDVGEDGYYDYQKDSMQIPLPFTDDDGNQLFLKANLPLSDLGEWMSNPIQRTVSSTSPIIKAPIEYVTGVDTFTGQPSYKTKTEQLLTSLGLQNVTTNLKKKAEAIVARYEGDTTNQEMMSELFRSIVQNVNAENIKQSGLYDELEGYQALVKQLKDEGREIPTITEINRNAKNKVNALMRKRTSS